MENVNIAAADTESVEQIDLAALMPKQEAPAPSREPAESTSVYPFWKETAQKYGKRIVAANIALAAVGAPVASTINDVRAMRPTHVPVTIAGSEVEVSLVPGRDSLEIDALGHAFSYPSQLRAGTKTLGATVVFHTQDLSLARPDGTPDANKIEAVVRQFSDPTPQKHEIEQALIKDIEHHAARTGLETLGVEALVAGLYIHRRRQLRGYTHTQRENSIRDRRVLTGVGLAALLTIADVSLVQAGSFYASPNKHQIIEADQALKGTVAEGWQIKGPFASFVDLSWHRLNKISSDKNKYYADMLSNFNTAFVEKYGTSSLEKPAHTKRILFLDDLQGMDGPTVIVGAAAKAFNVDVIAIGGDTEDSDTPFISVLDGLHEHAKSVPVIMGTGIHDPANIGKMARERGFFVADNKVQTVAGIQFVAAADASTYEAFAVNENLIKPGFTNLDIAKIIVDESCSSNKPVIALMHDHSMGNPVAEANCAADVLMGRSYVPPAPVDYGKTVAITSGSTGGHAFSENINLTGIIAAKAEFQIIDVNAKTLQFESSILVTMDPVPKVGTDTSKPSRSVTIGPLIERAQIAKAPSNVASPRHQSFIAAKP